MGEPISKQKQIRPVEDYVLKGIQERFSEVFGCMSIMIAAEDKAVALKAAFEGRTPEVPYAFLKHTSFATNTNGYNRRSLARHGLIAVKHEGITHKIKLLPTVYDIEVEYVTDRFIGYKNSVLAFSRRWISVLHQNHLRFGFGYGNLQFNVSDITMQESVPITPRSNPVENVTQYSVITSFQVKSFMSEPMLMESSVIEDMQVGFGVGGGSGKVVSTQFISFDELRVTNK